RTKTFIQLYESGLYLTKQNRDAKAIIAADELMAIRVKITSGFVSRSALLKSLDEGLVKSTKGQVSKIKTEREQFVKTLREEVNKNDIYDFVHIPQKGLYILKNGKVQGSIAGLEFKKALFGIWLCDTPADQKLKQAMLSAGKLR
ncbi:MAG: chalcone isomerase family protein, partial [Planctomycetota bacterium]